MKGFLKRTAVMLACALGAVGGCHTTSGELCPPEGGCPTAGQVCCSDGSCPQAAGHHKKGVYDPCWMERYGSLAQREVNRSFAPQVQNGHVLDQTVWNHHFEAGTAKLTEGGISHLEYLSRRRPEPDRTIYLATAMDLQYDPNCPERFAGARQELDSLRVAAVQKFLVAVNAGRCQDFQVLVHDPADPTVGGVQLPGAVPLGIPRATNLMYSRFVGGTATAVGGPSGSGVGGR